MMDAVHRYSYSYQWANDSTRYTCCFFDQDRYSQVHFTANATITTKNAMVSLKFLRTTEYAAGVPSQQPGLYQVVSIFGHLSLFSISFLVVALPVCHVFPATLLCPFFLLLSLFFTVGCVCFIFMGDIFCRALTINHRTCTSLLTGTRTVLVLEVVE